MEAMEKANAKRNVLNPEDNPTGYISAYTLQRSIDNMKRFTENAGIAKDWLTAADDQFQAISALLSGVRFDSALAGNNGVYDLQALQALAGSVMGAYNALFDIANTQYKGKYMFGGYETNTAPFQNSNNTVKNVIQLSGGTGGNISAAGVYSDLPELSSGQYTVKIEAKGDTGYLSILDSYGNKVLLDSNGTDEATKAGNDITTSLAFKIEAGKTINTGRGLVITLPDDVAGGATFQLKYEAGAVNSYYGDMGKVMNQIGFNQNVAINFNGNEIFTQNSKILQTGLMNSVGGVPLTASSYFSQIYGANSGAGDSISFTGTDHKGLPVGAAKLSATNGVSLNMTKASKEERTLTIGYAGKYYQIEIPAKGYKDMDELLFTINNQLKTATYAGSQSLVSHYADTDDMASAQNAEINAGLVNSGYQIDLSCEISITADGDRLLFSTYATGNKTALSVTGFKHNTLGFDDKTVASIGGDTVFEIGQAYDESGIHTFFTKHSNVNLSGVPDEQIFIINGNSIVIEGFSAATTLEERELLIDRALQRAGYGYSVTAKLQETSPGFYDVTFTLQNVNYGRDTFFATTYYDPLSPVTTDYQVANLPTDISSYNKEQKVSDLLNFIERLYDGGVSATIVDGCIQVMDLRSGESRMTMNMLTNNQGMSYPLIDQNCSVTGRYTGGKDAVWGVTAEMTHNADGTRDVLITIRDEKGNTALQKTVQNYQGGEITLMQGIKLRVDDMNTTPGTTAMTEFKLNLRANASLSFGNIKVLQEGKNTNMFTSLMSLYDALNNGVANFPDTTGKGAPSAWSDTNLLSSAIPYFEGTFTGHSNATWKYEVQSQNGQREYYLQSEFSQKTGALALLPGATTLDFEVQTYDNSTGQLARRSVSVPLAGITTEAELARAITQTINNDPVFYQKDIHAYVDTDGKVVFESGSGAKNITIIPSDENAVYMMGRDAVAGSPPASVFTAQATLDFHHYTAGAWSTTTVTVPAGTYTAAQVAAVIDGQLPAGASASLDSNGVVRFASADPFYYDNVASPANALGLHNTTQNYVSGNSTPKLDMRALDADARTLTFRYSDGVTENTVSITIDAKEYMNLDEIMSEINSKINTVGLSSMFQAVSYSNGVIAFEPPAGYYVSIEGDHAASLGFARTGDEVSVKVTDEKGNLIQNLKLDSANEEYKVADGVMLGFDAGSLFTTDSFTGVVGSGVGYELGELDQAITQLLTALTQVGNSVSRVESIINFQQNLTITSIEHQALHLGASDIVQINQLTAYEAARNAYAYALQLTTQMMSTSILNYLR